FRASRRLRRAVSRSLPGRCDDEAGAVRGGGVDLAWCLAPFGEQDRLVGAIPLGLDVLHQRATWVARVGQRDLMRADREGRRLGLECFIGLAVGRRDVEEAAEAVDR